MQSTFKYLISVVLSVDFSSCHSFGVAVGLRCYGIRQMCAGFRRRIFLKMRRVGCIIF